MADTVATPPSPLTTLSEEETLFRDAVREFAETDVRPLVQAMDDYQAGRLGTIPADGLRPYRPGR